MIRINPENAAAPQLVAHIRGRDDAPVGKRWSASGAGRLPAQEAWAP